MNTKSKLKDKLVKRIHRLSTQKLTEVDSLLNKIEMQLKSKEVTLKLAGSWKDLDEEIFQELTENLHSKRANDRNPLPL